jgi:hypothetical protein
MVELIHRDRAAKPPSCLIQSIHHKAGSLPLLPVPVKRSL